MDLIDSEEAAKILGLSRARLLAITREGQIRAYPSGKAYLYDPNEVHQLKDLRKSNVTFVEVAAAATRSELAALRLEKKLDMLCSMLGANIPCADVSVDAVVALHLKVQDTYNLSGVVPTLGDVIHWAKIFQSLSEQYFHVVSSQFLTDEPWAPYIDLVNKMISTAPWKHINRDVELRFAYDLLDLGRRTMRQTAFFYVCRTANKRLAHQMFPESLGDVHEDVLAMLAVIKN